MNCAYCKTEFWSCEKDVTTCSSSCSQAQEMADDLGRLFVNVKPSGDTRIFFYPLSFGRLLDEYVTLSLKRANTRSIRYQQELGFLIFRCRKGIETNLGQLAYSKIHRESFQRLSQRLFKVCSELWRYNELARDKRASDYHKKTAALELIALNDSRHEIIKELDILYQGKSNHVRIYFNREI